MDAELGRDDVEVGVGRQQRRELLRLRLAAHADEEGREVDGRLHLAHDGVLQPADRDVDADVVGDALEVELLEVAPLAAAEVQHRDSDEQASDWARGRGRRRPPP